MYRPDRYATSDHRFKYSDNERGGYTPATTGLTGRLQFCTGAAAGGAVAMVQKRGNSAEREQSCATWTGLGLIDACDGLNVH